MAAYEGVLLYDSIICRLCGTENTEGIYLYDSENDFDFKSLINRYLPIKVRLYLISRNFSISSDVILTCDCVWGFA